MATIHKSDERLSRLYCEAERRSLEYFLSLEDGVIHVSSASRKGLWHRVELHGEFVTCFCETKEGKACTHQSLACSHWFPVTCYLKWVDEESAKFLEFRHKVRTGAKLSRSEKRKLNKAIASRSALMPERKMAA